MRTVAALLLALCAVVGSPRDLRAQAASPIERFVQTVGYLWGIGDAEALADLAREDGSLLLDTGRGTESVNARHAAAALRALFGERESVSVRPVRVTLSGGSPLRGFGELAWTSRSRGAPVRQTRTVYVGAVWTGRAWRISELRLMP